MRVTPFGAKSPSETVVGVAANADGNLVTAKKWENDMEVIYDGTPDSTSTLWLDVTDVSDSGAVSLRICQTSDAAYTIAFGTDTALTNYSLYGVDSGRIEFQVPASTTTRYFIVTPDDVPILAWIRQVRLAIFPASVPTVGKLKIWLATKK